MARSRLHVAAEWALSVSGATVAARRILGRKGRFAVLLHGIASARREEVAADAQPRLTSDDLAYLLEWLRPRFDLLTPEEYTAAKKPGVLLTFDDGFANNFSNALPVLRMFGAPAIFFVSAQHVAQPRDWLKFVREMATRGWGSLEAVPEDVACDWYDGMSVEQLRQCSADPLVTIGSHGETHAVLTECSDDELRRELRESKSFLEAVASKPIEFFAYPRGDYDARVSRCAMNAGYSGAFTIDPIGLGMPAFELPRVGIYEATPRYLGLKLCGMHRRPLPLVGPGDPASSTRALCA
jgi:peptidoglycan/xylan/chitin deacetylase (PgdA/CDA1 family)